MSPGNDPDSFESSAPRQRGVGSLSGLSGDDPFHVAQDLFHWIQKLVGIDGAIFFLLDGKELLARFGFEVAPAVMRGLRLSLETEGPIQASVMDNKTRLIAGRSELDDGVSMPWSVAVCIPLAIEGTPIGAYVAGWVASYDVDSDTLLVLEGAASLAASSIHRARLLYEVKREEQRLRTLLDSLPIPAVAYSTPELTVNYVNSEARRLIGDVRGKPVRETAMYLKAARLDSAVAAEEEPADTLLSPAAGARFQMTSIDGSTRTMLPHVTRLGPGGGVIMLVDVTKETNLEIQRKRFVRMVSHQLRTPLTPLMGFAELVASSVSEDDTVQQAAKELSAAVQEITGQVQRLEQIANLQPVDEGNLAPSSVRSLVSSAWEKAGGPAADLSIDGDLDTHVVCRSDYVIDAMFEVFANAYQHGRPPVAVSVLANSTGAAITVQDSGESISSEWESAVFTPYLTMKPGYTPPPAGHLGLGLTLARALMEATRVSSPTETAPLSSGFRRGNTERPVPSPLSQRSCGPSLYQLLRSTP